MPENEPARIARPDEPARTACTGKRKQQLLLAVGIISTPQFHHRRTLLRHSWLRSDNVGREHNKAICASFVVRAGGIQGSTATDLRREATVHKDVLLVRSIPWNEGRVRGPVLSLAWWLRFAHSRMAPQFIGKVDDDTHLNTPDLETLLRLVATTQKYSRVSSHVYLGVMTFSHWYPHNYDFIGHGLTYAGALHAGSHCRDTALQSPICTGDECKCVGPFAFAAGYLMVLSRALVSEMLTMGEGGMTYDVDQLMGRNPKNMIGRTGKPLDLIYEDVWLGSLLHRFPPTRQVKYISLPPIAALGGKGGAMLHSEVLWSFTSSRFSLLTHIRSKRPEYYLAAQAYSRLRGLHCSAPLNIRCEDCFANNKCAREADQLCTVQRLHAQRACCGRGARSRGGKMYGSELCYIGNASLSSPFTIGDSTLRSFRDAASRLETRRFDTPSDGPGSMTPEAWKALSAAATSARYTYWPV